MAKGNHLDKKKAKAKAEAREQALANRKPIKAGWSRKRIGLLLMVIALSLLMLIPLLSGLFDTGQQQIPDPNLGITSAVF